MLRILVVPWHWFVHTSGACHCSVQASPGIEAFEVTEREQKQINYVEHLNFQEESLDGTGID